MIAASILGGFLALLWFLDALGKRARARALSVLAPSTEPVAAEHVFIVRPGVVLPDATRRAASAHARAHGLLVVDLVSPNITSWRTQLLLTEVDPARFRAERITAGASACDALLVDADVLARASEGAKIDVHPQDSIGFAHLARALKHYACTQMDLAVAPGLESPSIPFRERRRILRIAFGPFVGPMIALQLGLLALSIAFAPAWGLAALGVWHFAILVTTLGTPLSPRDRALHVALRTGIDIASTFGPVPSVTRIAPDDLRGTYASLLAQGTSRFFEPVREDCPVCASPELSKMFDIGDRYQGKPGRFTLSRCGGCGHVFQNPRLSIDGLSFYYRDFYDGLGEEELANLFASAPAIYRARAEMVAAMAKPQRWLDVGAGHGHFCSIARDVLPDTRFDGLDLSESIEDAERRRWIDRGIRGLFPDVAPRLVEEGAAYDVISMSHYLEHTIDPRAEIGAAASVLSAGGLFFIELPDPDSRFGRLLGRQWMPWFQPQHLHFLSAKNLQRLLKENGFEPIAWHRGEAHQPVDFTFSTYLMLAHLAPLIDGPWRRSSGGAVGRLAKGALRTVWLPFFLIAWLLDRGLAPLARRPGWSNTYRVVARRV